jgi:hypothetical protein
VMHRRWGWQERARAGWMLAAASALALAPSSQAQVGYAMRGDTRPFHQWDSAFNTTPRGDTTDGLAWNPGPLDLRPTLGLWAGYDSNLFLDPDNESDDSYWTVAPGVLLLYGNEERNYLTLHYEFENTDYTDFDSEDYDSHLLSAGMQFKGRGYTTRLSEQFSDSTETVPETGNRVSRVDNTTRASIDRQISRRSGAEVHGAYELVNYDGSGFIDYDEYSGGLDLRHQTWPQTQLTVGADYGVVDVSGPESLGDATYVETAVGARGQPMARTEVIARVGYQWRDFEDDLVSIEDWVASIGASRTFWRDSVAGVRVSRRFFPSAVESGGTRVSTDISPYLQHTLLYDLLAISVNGTYAMADFYDPEGESSRSDDRWQLSGVLDWRAASMLSIGVGYTHEEQDSDDAEFSYNRQISFIRALANY